jgi:hypothetical protein
MRPRELKYDKALYKVVKSVNSDINVFPCIFRIKDNAILQKSFIMYKMEDSKNKKINLPYNDRRIKTAQSLLY